MKLPERREFLFYAEGDRSQNEEAQRQILNLLASSQIIRQQLVEVKKDLYTVSVQVPDYHPTAQFGAELARLSETWAKVAYDRKFSLKNFYRSREFFSLMIFVAAMILMLLYFLGLSLI